MSFGLALLAAFQLFSQQATQEPPPDVRFGTTVYAETGFEGQIYFLDPDTKFLPYFKKMKPIGKIYTNILNVPPQSFEIGFPGVTDRFEWFAIDYTGKFWIDKPGKYTFALISDDGSKLYIDGKTVVDNDGIHGARGLANYKNLKLGSHDIRVSYFQGPRNTVALQLLVAGPGEELRVFNSEEFRNKHPQPQTPPGR